MILIFGKKVIDASGVFVLLPRAEFNDVEKAAGVQGTIIALSRAGQKCTYALEALDQHDYHAPPWMADGTAPVQSTVPGMTVKQYRDQIVVQIMANNPMKADLTVEVKDVDLPAEIVAESDEGDDGGDGPTGNEDGWNNNPILN